MEKQIIILSALLFIAFTGCKQVDKLTHFNVPVSKSVTIPVVPLAPLDIPKQYFTLQTGIQSKLKAYNTSENLIEQVFLKNLTIELPTPTDENLDFLKSIKVYISADELEEILIASKTDIPTPAGTKIDLDVENVDLRQYIIKDPLTLAVEVAADQITTAESTVSVSALFLVDAKILGI